MPRGNRAQVKALIGELRRARGWSVERLAAHPLVRVTPKKLQEYERPGGPCPSRVMIAALAYALEAPRLLHLQLPDGWLCLSPDQVGLVRPALVAAGLLPG